MGVSLSNEEQTRKQLKLKISIINWVHLSVMKTANEFCTDITIVIRLIVRVARYIPSIVTQSSIGFL